MCFVLFEQNSKQSRHATISPPPHPYLRLSWYSNLVLCECVDTGNLGVSADVPQQVRASVNTNVRQPEHGCPGLSWTSVQYDCTIIVQCIMSFMMCATGTGAHSSASWQCSAHSSASWHCAELALELALSILSICALAVLLSIEYQISKPIEIL